MGLLFVNHGLNPPDGKAWINSAEAFQALLPRDIGRVVGSEQNCFSHCFTSLYTK